LRNLYDEKIAKDIVKKKGEIFTHYYVEKGVDIAIAVDMIQLAYSNSYDVAILVSGDGDFAKAIKAVKDQGKHVEVAFFKKDFSYHLSMVADKRIYLDNIITNCIV